MFDKSLYMHIFVMCLCVGNPLLSLNCKLASFGHPHDLMSIEKKKNKKTSKYAKICAKKVSFLTSLCHETNFVLA